MSTLATCPYCSVQLGMSSMRAHIVLCGRNCNRANSKDRIDAVDARRRSTSISTDKSAPKRALRVEKAAPSQSFASRDTPAVLHVDLRSTAGENLNLKTAKKPEAGSLSGRKKHLNQSRGSSVSPQLQNADDELAVKTNSFLETNAEFSGQEAYANEYDDDDDACGGELKDVEKDRNAVFSTNYRLFERVAQLEAENEEIRAALAREREERRKSTFLFEGALASVRSELVALRTLTGDAAGTAKSANDGVECMKKQLECFATREALGELQEKVEGLLQQQQQQLWLRQEEQKAQRDAGSSGAAPLANTSMESFSPASRGIFSADVSGLSVGGRLTTAAVTKTPFLAKDTGEMIARFLYLQPAAVIQTAGKGPMIKTSGLVFEGN